MLDDLNIVRNLPLPEYQLCGRFLRLSVAGFIVHPLAVAGAGTAGTLSTTGLPKSLDAGVHSPNPAQQARTYAKCAVL
jgi:hypothetical protein